MIGAVRRVWDSLVGPLSWSITSAGRHATVWCRPEETPGTIARYAVVHVELIPKRGPVDPGRAPLWVWRWLSPNGYVRVCCAWMTVAFPCPGSLA